MKSAAFLLVMLALLGMAFSASLSPNVEAAAPPPSPLKTFSGSLDPGTGPGITDPPLKWELGLNVTEFLFHYKVTGGSEASDVVYAVITEINWPPQPLMGEGWLYCACSLTAGSHSVTVEADEGASGRMSYEIGFYLAQQPPVEFSGFNPANSQLASNTLVVSFQSAGDHTVLLGVTAGDYELFVDGESEGVASGTTQFSDTFTSGLHVFDIVFRQGDVKWSVQILGPPKLEVRILNPCPTLNPESGQSKCVIGAEATASDGSSPAISYRWSASGGKFNSTTGRRVEWTAPRGVADFTLTVQASSSGYTSGTASITAKVVPEFPSGILVLLAGVVLAFTLIARRSRRQPAEYLN